MVDTTNRRRVGLFFTLWNKPFSAITSDTPASGNLCGIYLDFFLRAVLFLAGADPAAPITTLARRWRLDLATRALPLLALANQSFSSAGGSLAMGAPASSKPFSISGRRSAHFFVLPIMATMISWSPFLNCPTYVC